MTAEDIKQVSDFIVETTQGSTNLYALCKRKGLILYFYPKVMTPGCTKQACDFRDVYSDLTEDGWGVAAVSADPLVRHQQFADKYALPFTLIADESHALSEHLGMWVEKSMFGKKYKGMQRSICIINPQGEVLKIWRKVSVLTHLTQVKKFIRSLHAS